MSYSGDGAFLPSEATRPLYVAPPIPTFTSDVVDPSFQVYAVEAADWPPLAVTTGDVDGDGIRDIVSVDFFNGLIGVSLTWAGTPTTQQYAGTDPRLFGLRGLLVADVTQDGRADVVAVDASAGLVVFRQA